MKKLRILISLITTLSLTTTLIGSTITNSTNDISITINTNENISKISPYIYGVNEHYNLGKSKVNFSRLGGNRMSGYNWENNFSNAGADWYHYSDDYMVRDIPHSQRLETAKTLTTFHEKSLNNDIDYSLLTVQMAGYVANDNKKEVTLNEIAPSSRWDRVEFKKNAPFSLVPDKTDGVVYIDEQINFLINKFGDSTSSTGIKAYALDNEPGLWSETHSRLHPEKVTCSELVEKSIALASAIKDMDKNAEIYGPALYGFGAYTTLQSAPDWKDYSKEYRWFVDYYLDNMRKAEILNNRRLLDVVDFHFYSEDRGDCKVADCTNFNHTKCNEARVQAPRSLWDPSYIENSWIGQWFSSLLPLIPNIQASVDKYYPGTKIAFTEYNFGGENHITGGIATADALGIFGENNVYSAALWQLDKETKYSTSALQLYTNYDNNNSKYGDLALKVNNTSFEKVSVYSSKSDTDPNKLHIILINKDLYSDTKININLNGTENYNTGSVYGFNDYDYNINKKDNVIITNNTLSYTLPKASVYHVVLEKSNENTINTDINNDGLTTIDDLSLIATKYNTQAHNENFLSNYDLNKDSIIDLYDLVIVSKAITFTEPEDPTTPSYNSWKSGVNYKVGDIVLYKNYKYKCLMSHTSHEGWLPDSTQTLWQKI